MPSPPRTSNPSIRDRTSKIASPEVPRDILGRAKLVFRTVPKALGLVWAASPGIAAANLSLTVFQGVLPAVTIWFSKTIVDGVVAAARTGTRADTVHVLIFVALWFGVLSYTPKLPVRANPVSVPNQMRQGLLLENVSFKYSGMENWVLKNISFGIRPGEAVALVGANGAGKTTLHHCQFARSLCYPTRTLVP